jgi:glycine cleavage system H lipoate-binding protein
MQSGIVSHKLCSIDYSCKGCSFENAMRRAVTRNTKAGEQGKIPQGRASRIIAWEEKLKSLPLSQRPCIHHLKGRINFRPCTNEYRCGNCEFDQFFYDEYTVHAVVNPVEIREVEGFKVPQGYYFHQGHGWVKIEEGSSVRIGVDDFALKLLGPLDHIETPLIGKAVRQGEPHLVLSRGQNKARVLSPVSGVVTAVNLKVREKGNLANQDPYSGGWAMTLHPTRLREELKNLMIAGETEEFLDRELERLHRLIEEVASPLAADGGNLGDDLFGAMPRLGWERLTRTFLRT